MFIPSVRGKTSLLQPMFFFQFQRASLALTISLHSKGATDVKVTADMVKAALEEAEKAQNAAEKAIKQADEDIKGTQDLLTSVSSLWVFLKIIEAAPSLMLRNWCKPV